MSETNLPEKPFQDTGLWSKTSGIVDEQIAEDEYTTEDENITDNERSIAEDENIAKESNAEEKQSSKLQSEKSEGVKLSEKDTIPGSKTSKRSSINEEIIEIEVANKNFTAEDEMDNLARTDTEQSIRYDIPLTKSNVMEQLKLANEEALLVKESIERMKADLLSYSLKEALTEEDTLELQKKQAELVGKLGQFERITKAIEDLVGLGVKASSQLTKEDICAGAGEEPIEVKPGEICTCVPPKCTQEYKLAMKGLRPYPEDCLPKVIVCGIEEHSVPKIVVCDTVVKPLDESLFDEECECQKKRRKAKQRLQEDELKMLDELRRKCISLQCKLDFVEKENENLTQRVVRLKEKEKRMKEKWFTSPRPSTVRITCSGCTISKMEMNNKHHNFRTVGSNGCQCIVKQEKVELDELLTADITVPVKNFRYSLRNLEKQLNMIGEDVFNTKKFNEERLKNLKSVYNVPIFPQKDPMISDHCSCE